MEKRSEKEEKEERTARPEIILKTEPSTECEREGRDRRDNENS